MGGTAGGTAVGTSGGTADGTAGSTASGTDPRAGVVHGLQACCTGLLLLQAPLARPGMVVAVLVSVQLVAVLLVNLHLHRLHAARGVTPLVRGLLVTLLLVLKFNLRAAFGADEGVRRGRAA